MEAGGCLGVLEGGGGQLPCEEFYYGLFRAYEHYLPLRRDLGRAPPSPLSSRPRASPAQPSQLPPALALSAGTSHADQHRRRRRRRDTRVKARAPTSAQRSEEGSEADVGGAEEGLGIARRRVWGRRGRGCGERRGGGCGERRGRGCGERRGRGCGGGAEEGVGSGAEEGVGAARWRA